MSVSKALFVKVQVLIAFLFNWHHTSGSLFGEYASYLTAARATTLFTQSVSSLFARYPFVLL
jgi:hypothetical protein